MKGGGLVKRKISKYRKLLALILALGLLGSLPLSGFSVGASAPTVPAEDLLKSDINDDGTTDILDLLIMRSDPSGEDFDWKQRWTADIDSDETVDDDDFALLKEHLLRKSWATTNVIDSFDQYEDADDFLSYCTCSGVLYGNPYMPFVALGTESQPDRRYARFGVYGGNNNGGATFDINMDGREVAFSHMEKISLWFRIAPLASYPNYTSHSCTLTLLLSGGGAISTSITIPVTGEWVNIVRPYGVFSGIGSETGVTITGYTLFFKDMSTYAEASVIEVDSISVQPLEPYGRIEAETGEMSGEAFVFTQAGASESRVVTGLDATEGNLNKVTFKDLPTQGRGTYTLKMVYSSATNGILLAIVNGVPMEMPWTFTDTTWAYVPNTLTLDIPLRGDGTDTIAFTIKNSGEYIWLDYFYLTFKSSEIVKPEGMVEAEIGHLGGSAEIKSNNVASEGKYVTGLHSAAGNPNFVSLSGNQLVKEAGVYDMSIAYSAAQSGVLGVELNGVTYEVPYGFTDVDGAFSLSAATLWRVPFKGDGTDIVKFYDIEGSISLDYIQLTRKGDTPPAYLYEGEKAEMHGEAAAMPKPQGENPNEAFSGGGYAYNFNFDKPGSFVRFKNLGVTAENAGRYKVTATLMALVNGNIGVRVNGYEVIAPFTFDAEKPWIPNVTVEVEVALRGGDDDYIDIFVPDANTNWFWLDCIKIEYIGEDVSDLRTDRLEAEDAEYDEAIVPKREESNGAFTITLPADGVVTFRDVMTSAIDKAGVYTMNIVYRTAVENARLQATVSHEEENPDGTIVLLDLLKSEGLTMVSKNVTLQGDGSDCIEIQALGGEIAIDYITFTYFGEIIPGLTLEAEDATVDDACIVTDDAASNRQAVTGLQDGKTLTYKNIIVPASGVYNLILQYKAEEAGQAQIVVNGRAAQTLSYEAGESFAQSAALAVPLKGDGTDTIVIADAESGKSFVLDYAVLQYVKPIVSSNKTLTVDYAKPYGSATIAAGKAENLTSLDSEGVNFDENKMYKPGGDSYIAFEDLAIYKPGWYNLRLDAGYNAYATRMIVTVNAGAADEKTSGYVINTDGYTEPMLVYLRGDGTDSIRIEELTGGTWSYGFVRGIVLSPADVAYFSEAEEADEVHGVIHGYAENDVLYRPCKSSGLAYVDSFHTSTGEGVIFERVNVAEAGEYILNIRAFNGGDAMLDVVVNGTTYKVSFNTGDWETFTTRQVNIPLQAGDNTIQIKYGDGATYAAIDYISVTSGSIIEFETANTAGSIVSATSGGAAGCDGASGGQVFNNIGTGTVTIALPTDLVQNGHYRLNFGVVPVFLIDIAGTVNDETFTVKLSGFPTQSFSKPSGFAVENITLKGDGTDTIVLTLNDNWAHLDYVYLQYMGDEAPLL